jgi:hypothetical protein
MEMKTSKSTKENKQPYAHRKKLSNARNHMFITPLSHPAWCDGVDQTLLKLINNK